MLAVRWQPYLAKHCAASIPVIPIALFMSTVFLPTVFLAPVLSAPLFPQPFLPPQPLGASPRTPLAPFATLLPAWFDIYFLIVRVVFVRNEITWLNFDNWWEMRLRRASVYSNPDLSRGGAHDCQC